MRGCPTRPLLFGLGPCLTGREQSVVVVARAGRGGSSPTGVLRPAPHNPRERRGEGPSGSLCKSSSLPDARLRRRRRGGALGAGTRADDVGLAPGTVAAPAPTSTVHSRYEPAHRVRTAPRVSGSRAVGVHPLADGRLGRHHQCWGRRHPLTGAVVEVSVSHRPGRKRPYSGLPGRRAASTCSTLVAWRSLEHVYFGVRVVVTAAAAVIDDRDHRSCLCEIVIRGANFAERLESGSLCGRALQNVDQADILLKNRCSRARPG